MLRHYAPSDLKETLSGCHLDTVDGVSSPQKHDVADVSDSVSDLAKLKRQCRNESFYTSGTGPKGGKLIQILGTCYIVWIVQHHEILQATKNHL